jgi:SAM-dependent methyltransferase
LTLRYTARDLASGGAGQFPVVFCHGCGLLFLRERPDRESIKHYYRPDYYSYQQKSEDRLGLWCFLKGRVKGWVRRQLLKSSLAQLLAYFLLPIDWFVASRYKPKGRAGNILDIGCGVGDALEFYREFGWQTYGVEVNEPACRIAQTRGHAVMCGELSVSRLVADKVDLFRMSHVIEHIHDPLEALSIAYQLLGADGRLLIITPNHGGWLARLFGRWYWQIDVPRHLFFFTRTTLSQMLQSCGFRVLFCRTVSQIIGPSYSLAYYLAQGAGHEERKRWRWFSVVLGLILGLVARVMDILGWGDNLIVVACKAVENGNELAHSA